MTFNGTVYELYLIYDQNTAQKTLDEMKGSDSSPPSAESPEPAEDHRFKSSEYPGIIE